MKSSSFEQAAAEARAGIREIDAEIDRLKAHRELLEVFETLARQVLTVLPMSAEETPSSSGGAVGRPGAPATEQSAHKNAAMKGGAEPIRKEERPAEPPAHETSASPEPRQLPRAESHAQDEPHLVRNQAWPTSLPPGLPSLKKLV